MQGIGLLGEVKIIKTFDEVGAAASNATSAVVIDTANAEGVIFITLFGTPAADNGTKIQQDNVVGMGAAADLAGSQKFVGATATVAVNQVHKPRERFLRVVAVRGTSSTVPAGFAIVYGCRTRPSGGAASTDLSINDQISPAEGTA